MTTDPRLPRDAFEALVGDLSAESFVRFVADLYSAQGWDVSRNGQILDLSREGPIPAQQSVLAVTEPSETSGDVDAVVDVVASPRRTRTVEVIAADLGARLQGPDDLYDLAMFGVDRQSTTSILGEYFGRDAIAEASVPLPTRKASVTERSEEPSESIDSSESAPPWAVAVASWEWSGPEWSAVLPVTALLVVLVILAGVGGALDPGLLFGSEDPTDASGPTTAPTTEESAASPSETSTAAAQNQTGDSDRRLLDGGSDPDAAVQPRYIGLTPTCERPPGLVAVIIVESLRNNDPETDRGIRTAWNFSSRMSRRATFDSFHRFVTGEEFDPLYDFESATYTPAYRDPGVSAHRVTVTDRAGASHTYLFVLSDQTGSNRKGCWLLAGIVDE